jgi:hypothetical protein
VATDVAIPRLSEIRGKRPFRLDKLYLFTSIVTLCFFIAFGGFSVYSAYFNVDGSFPRPKLFALIFGVFWSGPTMLNIWLLLAYVRERLYLLQDQIIQEGVFRCRVIPVKEVIQIEWIGQWPDILIRGEADRIRIYLSNFKWSERQQIITYFRNGFPLEIQKNWKKLDLMLEMEEKLIRPEPSRVLAAICSGLLFLTSGLGAYCFWYTLVAWQYDFNLPSKLAIGALVLGCALAGLHYVWRIIRWRDAAALNSSDIAKI